MTRKVTGTMQLVKLLEMQKLHSMCPEKQGLILMFGHRCKDCHALFVEMRSAVGDAKSIVAEAGVLIHVKALRICRWMAPDSESVAERQPKVGASIGGPQKSPCDTPVAPLRPRAWPRSRCKQR